VAIANSIWARKDLTFKQDFLDRNRDYYGAEVTNLDFGSAEAVQAINQWVSKHTHDKIPTIVKQIDRDMAMYLINAVYFKASWQDPFDKKNTKEQPFHLAGGGTSPCQMMTRADTMSHATGAGWEGVELPYSRGRMSMYVFLPAQGSKLTDLMQTLTAQTWDATLASFKHERGSVSLPKFKVEWEANLNSALIALGMGSAFDPQTADFTGMGGAKGFLYIGEVKHKTYIDVNEVGTEAAAVTSVGMKATGMPAGEPFHLVADRPFFYVIRDNKSKAILFMGLLYKP
jgi:serpin B